MRFSSHRECYTLFAALAVVACLLATGVPSAEAYDPLDPTGNITIVWDVTSWAGDGYIAWVKMYNYYQHYPRSIPRLGADVELDPWRIHLGSSGSRGHQARRLLQAAISRRKDPHSPMSPVFKNCCKGGYLGAN
ncbi:hypothetical protein CLOM_g12818 [Closterium sp. NIES-68]|nr:hypothetical protein CLOM_g12818 [Closterium sp. NIES-68]